MTFIYNDGGRADAGFKGTAGDCVARSIAIISGRSYREVYDALAKGNAEQRITKGSKKSTAGVRTARSGISVKRQWFKDLMQSWGFRWVPLAGFGEKGCLPSEVSAFAVVASQRKHYVAIKDGVVHDVFDSSNKLVYGYWTLD